MNLTPTNKHIILIAGISGTIQALAWIVMTLAAIAVYLGSVEPTFDVNRYFDTVKSIIYIFSLHDYEERYRYQVMTGQVFHIFMWVHLAVNILWLVTSFYGFSILMIPNAFRLRMWGYVILLVSFLDFVTVVVFGVDYQNCLAFVHNLNINFSSENTEAACANGVLIPLVIAAKGFTLWCINVCFGVYFVKLCKKFK